MLKINTKNASKNKPFLHTMFVDFKTQQVLTCFLKPFLFVDISKGVIAQRITFVSKIDNKKQAFILLTY